MKEIQISNRKPYQVHAQTSPLTEDQDGDGDPLNEEAKVRLDCFID